MATGRNVTPRIWSSQDREITDSRAHPEAGSLLRGNCSVQAHVTGTPAVQLAGRHKSRAPAGQLAGRLAGRQSLRVFVGVLHMIERAATQGWREALAAFDKRWPGRIPAWPCNTRHGAARGVYEVEYSLNSPLSASYIAPGCSNGQTVAAVLPAILGAPRREHPARYRSVTGAPAACGATQGSPPAAGPSRSAAPESSSVCCISPPVSSASRAEGPGDRRAPRHEPMPLPSAGLQAPGGLTSLRAQRRG